MIKKAKKGTDEPAFILTSPLTPLRVTFIPQPPRNPHSPIYPILRMNTPFTNRHICKIKRTHPLNTRNIHTILIRRRTPLVEGIDAAPRAEVMLSFPCMELIKGQCLLPLRHSDIA